MACGQLDRLLGKFEQYSQDPTVWALPQLCQELVELSVDTELPCAECAQTWIRSFLGKLSWPDPKPLLQKALEETIGQLERQKDCLEQRISSLEKQAMQLRQDVDELRIRSELRDLESNPTIKALLRLRAIRQQHEDRRRKRDDLQAKVRATAKTIEEDLRSWKNAMTS